MTYRTVTNLIPGRKIDAIMACERCLPLVGFGIALTPPRRLLGRSHPRSMTRCFGTVRHCIHVTVTQVQTTRNKIGLFHKDTLIPTDAHVYQYNRALAALDLMGETPVVEGGGLHQEMLRDRQTIQEFERAYGDWLFFMRSVLGLYR